MSTHTCRPRGFTVVEIMTVVAIVGILSSLALPALMRVKHKSEDTLALNTLRQLYDAKEMYFTEDGAGKAATTVPKLVKAGYVSHSLEAATQHNIGAWGTAVLPGLWLKPGVPIKISEVFSSGGRINYGRTMSYPEPR